MASTPRPDIDVVLSLHYDYYKDTMHRYYQKLGSKKNSTDEQEKEAVREIFELFSNRVPGETVRFFKMESRSNKNLIEVDETTAMESEWSFVIFTRNLFTMNSQQYTKSFHHTLLPICRDHSRRAPKDGIFKAVDEIRWGR